jgi:membrane fusion protein, heavy metal efflux system
MKTQSILLLALWAVALAACGERPSGNETDHGSGGSDEQAAAADYERGPHGGRMLRSKDFALEVKIFEDGVPPEYHLYASAKNAPVPPSDVEATVVLKRLGGRVDTFKFKPVGDFLRGDGVVVEPHSFDVEVAARHAGQQYEWKYESHEGRTRIADEIAKLSGLGIEVAGSGVLRDELELTGIVQAPGDRSGRVTARFPGVVRDLRHAVGDRVARGAVLATIQSNESLENYALTAPIAGTVLERNAQVGEVTTSDPLFVIADLSTVWAELDAYGADLSRLAVGQRAFVESVDASARGEGKLVRIAPIASQTSQSVRARVALANADGTWRPGQFVRGRIVIAETPVPLAVRNVALQQFRDFQVVFAQVGDVYEVRMLDLGRRDREITEILGGLEPGTRYVTDNSFLIKADVEKSGASHDH